MADGISFKMITGPFHAGITARQAKMPGAASAGLREAAKAVLKASRGAAPVLKDSTKTSYRKLVRQKKQGVDTSAAFDKPVPGLLRASIVAGRVKKTGPSSYSLKISPSGYRVHFYAGKEEARARYMAAGEQAAQTAIVPATKTMFDRAWK
jgi:hypothetical protein